MKENLKSLNSDKTLTYRLITRKIHPKYEYVRASLNNANFFGELGLSTLTFTKYTLTINYLSKWHKLYFLKEDIVGIGIEKGMFFDWIVINHKIDKYSYPTYLAFGSISIEAEKILKEIELLNFFKDEPKSDSEIIDKIRALQKEEIPRTFLFLLLIGAVCFLILIILGMLSKWGIF